MLLETRRDISPPGSGPPRGSDPSASPANCSLSSSLGRIQSGVMQGALHGLMDTWEGGSLTRWGSPTGPLWVQEGLHLCHLQISPGLAVSYYCAQASQREPHPEATGHKICRLTLLTASCPAPLWSLLTESEGQSPSVADTTFPDRPSSDPTAYPPSLALVTSLCPRNMPTPGLPQGLCSGLEYSSSVLCSAGSLRPDIVCSDATLRGLSSDLWDPKPWPPSHLSSCSSSVPFAPPCCSGAVLRALGPEAGPPRHRGLRLAAGLLRPKPSALHCRPHLPRAGRSLHPGPHQIRLLLTGELRC